MSATRTMTTAEAVDYINATLPATGRRRRLGPDALRAWAESGYVPAARNGNRWLFTDTAIDRWLGEGMADWSKRGAA